MAQGYAQGDITILVRRNAEATQIANFLFNCEGKVTPYYLHVLLVGNATRQTIGCYYALFCHFGGQNKSYSHRIIVSKTENSILWIMKRRKRGGDVCLVYSTRHLTTS